MNEQSKKPTKPVKKRLSDVDFERLIKETITHSMGEGFVSKCYCKRCGASWDMRKGGIRILRKENPDEPFKTPMEIDNLTSEEELRKCFFVLEPCFVCRKRGEKIQTEVRLIPSQLAKESSVTWQKSFTLSNPKKS